MYSFKFRKSHIEYKLETNEKQNKIDTNKSRVQGNK